jgi:hypothetical protein
MNGLLKINLPEMLIVQFFNCVQSIDLFRLFIPTDPFNPRKTQSKSAGMTTAAIDAINVTSKTTCGGTT